VGLRLVGGRWAHGGMADGWHGRKRWHWVLVSEGLLFSVLLSFWSHSHFFFFFGFFFSCGLGAVLMPAITTTVIAPDPRLARLRLLLFLLTPDFMASAGEE